MTKSRPTTRAITELRAAAYRELDAIFDAWPAMCDLAATTDSNPRPDIEHTDADLIRPQGGTANDPTMRQALNITAARSWQRDLVRLLHIIETLAARATHAIGDLPEWACPLCRHDIADGRPTVKTNGQRVH